jgi:hypothetical protein
MTLFNFKKTVPQAVPKGTVHLFDRQVSLRYVKGLISNYRVKSWTRFFDKSGNIVRYGDGVDDEIIRSEKYKMLELDLTTLAYDSYMKPGHHESITTLYFERENLFTGFRIADTISYFGLFLTEAASWTDYFLYNHSRSTFTSIYSPDTVNKYIFDNRYLLTDLIEELEKKIKEVEIP